MSERVQLVIVGAFLAFLFVVGVIVPEAVAYIAGALWLFIMAGLAREVVRGLRP